MGEESKPQNGEQSIEVNLYEEVELHTNCTVQVLRNVLTGELSVGWWDNDVDNHLC